MLDRVAVTEGSRGFQPTVGGDRTYRRVATKEPVS